MHPCHRPHPPHTAYRLVDGARLNHQLAPHVVLQPPIELHKGTLCERETPETVAKEAGRGGGATRDRGQRMPDGRGAGRCCRRPGGALPGRREAVAATLGGWGVARRARPRPVGCSRRGPTAPKRGGGSPRKWKEVGGPEPPGPVRTGARTRAAPTL